MSTVSPDIHDDEHHGPATLKDGIGKYAMRWISTTNHKDLGTLYLLFSGLMLIVGGILSLVIRAELFAPGIQVVDPGFFNQAVSLHGLIMIFGGIMPAFVGLANWIVPMEIGCPDLAMPRVNNWAFWLLPFALFTLIATLFIEGGPLASGWTMYPPLFLQTGYSLAFTVFVIHMTSVSSIAGAINIIVTILNMRTPGMSLLRMPLFVWSWLVTAFLLLATIPVLSASVTLLLTDGYFGTTFFSAAGGGDPVLFQHIFWFFGHPEVYIMILPAFGIVSMIIPTFARKKLFGHDSMVYALACIALLSMIVWAHHMFAVGLPVSAELFFMFATMLISVPTGVKIFNWVATMWRGSMTFETPMLFALGFVVMFAIGGFSGLMMALVPVDFQYHDTYFIVAHFHYVLVPGALFSIIGAIYYWIPKWSGVMYNEKLGQIHFWWSAVWINVIFFPQHFVGLAGMPRRIPDYALQFANFNMVSSIGAFMFFIGQFIFLYNMYQCMRGAGKKATDRVWEGAHGLEWTVPSPAPYHTFETPPVLEESEIV
ncbi:MAG TPA: cytochrome c oxidase subunit 1 [Salinisphaeraceae bacterium]|nr:cytochrome c oxidase subunit 1 [Salinisphaeraceae bacterium]